MQHGRWFWRTLALASAYFLLSFRWPAPSVAGSPTAANVDAPTQVDRSPVDVALSADERRLVAINRGSDTISLLDAATGAVLDEIACARRPAAAAMILGDGRVLVTATFSGDLSLFDVSGDRLRRAGNVQVGFEPHSVAVSRDGKLAYVARTAASDVAVVDLERLETIACIPVGRWPRYLALSPDGTRLAVGISGDRAVAVVDAIERKLLYTEDLRGINLGQMQISADGTYAYFPWMVYRQNPITAKNIRLGWVLASRIARVRLDGAAPREAISLDPPGEAVSDPHGIGLTPDGKWLVCAASGTHELLVYRLEGLPFQGYGGPGDLIDRELARDRDRFYRIPLGGRPMMLRMAADSRHVYVANYLNNSVQVVDLVERRIAREFSLGGPAEPSLARQGEAIFYDGRRSLDQWYSCHSCHYEGAGNAVTMDTSNDGSIRTFKTVLSLYNVTKTAPWTWHGWQRDLQGAMKKSLTETMLGPQPTDRDAQALIAFFESLESPPSPYRLPDGRLHEAAMRGKRVFESEKAGCSNCHSGALFTDGQIHDVGLGSPSDAYQGFNTPSLINVHSRAAYLHNGRAKSLDDVLTGLHNPANVTGAGELSEDEREDLVQYLKSL